MGYRTLYFFLRAVYFKKDKETSAGHLTVIPLFLNLFVHSETFELCIFEGAKDDVPGLSYFIIFQGCVYVCVCVIGWHVHKIPFG